MNYLHKDHEVNTYRDGCVSMSVCPRALSPKLLNGSRWNLVCEVYAESHWTKLCF